MSIDMCNMCFRVVAMILFILLFFVVIVVRSSKEITKRTIDFWYNSMHWTDADNNNAFMHKTFPMKLFQMTMCYDNSTNLHSIRSSMLGPFRSTLGNANEFRNRWCNKNKILLRMSVECGSMQFCICNFVQTRKYMYVYISDIFYHVNYLSTC